ncbi:hypothetical protein [Pontibacillus salipaludis]|uniref:Uncharacterized protein n=1 Tax=Pontibacillus salipaludis TaxID=1697394 RepID=A0ABQ1PWA4_9BACI|nr:hypothetical protein [Pontibacillus salipaludis]GGD05322.1 hypothetical protein GCM10011389_11030 [Pontibacillus salipaludis]
MYKVLKQETVVYVIPSTKYGLDHDRVKIQSTMQLDEPLPKEEVLFVPSKTEKVDRSVRNFLNEKGFDFGPRLAKDINAKLKDYPEQVLDPERREESRQDSLLGYLLTFLDQINPEPIEGTSSHYHFEYEFPLYPNEAKEFEFMTSLPFSGFEESGRMELELIIILPEDVTFDPKETKGITADGQEITEKAFKTQNNRSLVTFYRQVDPDFFVTYKY